MQNKNILTILIVILLQLLMLSCIFTPPTKESLSITETASSTETQAGQAASDTPPPNTAASDTPQPPDQADPASDCPTDAPGFTSYISRENGFCLRYPAHFEETTYYERADERFSLLGPLLDPNAMETVRVSLLIETNGPAGGLDSFQYALQWRQLFSVTFDPEREFGYLDGQPAVTYRGLPGYGPAEQSTFVIANGLRYRIVLWPQPGDAPSLDEDISLVWETVSESIQFFPPESQWQYVLAEEVCPQGNADNKAYTRLIDGYCLLYPADFEETAGFPGQFKGGPVLEYGTAWGDVRTSLTLGSYGPSGGQTLMQLLQSRAEFIDMSSVVETSVGGHPAVIFRDPRGPWASRQAMILVDGNVYSLLAQPFEPTRYPQGIPYLDRLWDTVTGSLVFFTPWR